MECIIMARFKRSFLGYKQDDVEKLIHQENRMFEEENVKLRKELASLIEDNKRLKENLNDIRQQMQVYKNLRKELEEQLYHTHIDASGIVYDAEKKYEEMIKQKVEMMQAQEKKNKEIQSSINKLIREIHSILES
jgi:phage shock protein A